MLFNYKIICYNQLFILYNLLSGIIKPHIPQFANTIYNLKKLLNEVVLDMRNKAEVRVICICKQDFFLKEAIWHKTHKLV